MYTPKKGQLCQVYKGHDNVYPVEESLRCFVPDPLSPGELLIITKVDYHAALSSYYIEFMRDRSLFYSYFYEQVMFFAMDDVGVHKSDSPISTFEFPWISCD